MIQITFLIPIGKCKYQHYQLLTAYIIHLLKEIIGMTYVLCSYVDSLSHLAHFTDIYVYSSFHRWGSCHVQVCPSAGTSVQGGFPEMWVWAPLTLFSSVTQFTALTAHFTARGKLDADVVLCHILWPTTNSDFSSYSTSHSDDRDWEWLITNIAASS